MTGDQRLVDGLERIGRRIVAGEDLEQTLESVLAAMAEATGAARCSIMLRSGPDHLRIRAARGLPEHVVARTRVPIGEGIAGAVARSGVARLLRDAAAARGSRPSPTVYAGSSALGVPLHVDGEVIGVVNLADKRGRSDHRAGEDALREFGEDDLRAASVLAHQAALAIAAADAAATREEHAQLQANLSSLETRLLSLESQAGALSVIRQVTDSLASDGPLDEILASIVEQTTRLLGCRRGSLMLRDPGSRLMRMQAAVGIPGRVVARSRVALGEGVAGRCAELGEPLLVGDIAELRGQVPGAGQRGDEYRSRSAICVPLKLRGEVLGVLNLNDRRDGKDLGPEDLFVAQIVANQAAVAIWNGQLRDRAIAAAEAHQALAVAREIQQSFVPPDLATPALEIAARSFACAGAGGDYVDFWAHRSADGRETGRFALVIGDVSGHGMGAALVMATTRAFLRGLLAESDDPAAVLVRLNRLLGQDVRHGRFVTLFVGLLDPAAGTLTYASAGHDPPLHRRAEDGALHELGATGPPLAILDEASFPSRRIAIGPGDWLVLTTDGAWELTDARGEAFGRERLAAAVHDLAAEPPAALLAGLRRRIAGFADGQEPGDDISFAAVRIGGAP